MKKGISLIVLVITIIVMIILAAAIIISISNSNVINKANQAVKDTNLQSVKEAAALKYADVTLKMKEEGDDSILGGKTVGGYIQSALVSDGTIQANEKYIFADSGDVYGVDEYNSIDKDTVKDYRYINGTLYYVGTNIQNRLALKDNLNVNTEYIVISTDVDANLDGEYKLSELTGYQNSVKSYKSGFNVDISSTDTQGADVALLTGMKLYTGQNYSDLLGIVVVIGDLLGAGATYETGLAANIIEIALTYNGDAKQYTLDMFGTIEGYTENELQNMIFFASDIDMNGVITEADGRLLYTFAIYYGNGELDKCIGKTIRESEYYQNAQMGSASQSDTKLWYEANFIMDKVVTKLPADIAK